MTHRFAIVLGPGRLDRAGIDAHLGLLSRVGTTAPGIGFYQQKKARAMSKIRFRYEIETQEAAC